MSLFYEHADNCFQHNFFVKQSNLLSYKCWTRAASYSFAESPNLFFPRISPLYTKLLNVIIIKIYYYYYYYYLKKGRFLVFWNIRKQIWSAINREILSIGTKPRLRNVMTVSPWRRITIRTATRFSEYPLFLESSHTLL